MIESCDNVTKKPSASYIIERVYPYSIAFLITFGCWHFEFNMMSDQGYTDLLDGLVTLDSIIIGFLGTIMPIILSMKNESKFVKYVFENDTDNLFCKYLKTTLLIGICNVLITLLMNVRTAIPHSCILGFYYVWIFITISFLAATYRSMSHMIMLIFSRDEEVSGMVISKMNMESDLPEKRGTELKQKYKN